MHRNIRFYHRENTHTHTKWKINEFHLRLCHIATENGSVERKTYRYFMQFSLKDDGVHVSTILFFSLLLALSFEASDFFLFVHLVACSLAMLFQYVGCSVIIARFVFVLAVVIFTFLSLSLSLFIIIIFFLYRYLSSVYHQSCLFF